MDDTWTQIGQIFVDSGQVMVGDPCYLKDYEAGEFAYDAELDATQFSYAGACSASLSEAGAGMVGAYGLQHTSARAVCTRTGNGDGTYPVSVRYDDQGCIAEMRVVFLEPDDDEDEDEDGWFYS